MPIDDTLRGLARALRAAAVATVFWAGLAALVLALAFG